MSPCGFLLLTKRVKTDRKPWRAQSYFLWHMLQLQLSLFSPELSFSTQSHVGVSHILMALGYMVSLSLSLSLSICLSLCRSLSLFLPGHGDCSQAHMYGAAANMLSLFVFVVVCLFVCLFVCRWWARSVDPVLAAATGSYPAQTRQMCARTGLDCLQDQLLPWIRARWVPQNTE